jgi:hypothetical protein
VEGRKESVLLADGGLIHQPESNTGERITKCLREREFKGRELVIQVIKELPCQAEDNDATWRLVTSGSCYHSYARTFDWVTW